MSDKKSDEIIAPVVPASPAGSPSNTTAVAAANPEAQKWAKIEDPEYRGRDLELKRQALRIQKCTFWIGFAALLVSVSGFMAVVLTVRINTEQEKIASINMINGLQQSMAKITVDLDRVFVDRPELMPYFYGRKDISESDTNYLQVEATAVTVLDVFDIASSQPDRYKDQWKHPEAWDEWIIDTFSESPVLRQVLRKRADWYPGLTNYLSKPEVEAAEQESKTTPAGNN
ncbi:MAG TPA: hypothetical protein VG347_14530 [Verrucomicrobiae bacterium]|nr:hypothetical protein [Verrucomicrobiae bacterium]